MTDIIDGKIGDSGSYELDLVQGKLVFKSAYSAAGIAGSANVYLDPDLLIDKLAAVIPGKVDDAIFGILKQALKMIP